MKTYTELIKLSSFVERYEYLKLNGKIGLETFGSKRYLNQILYHTAEWRNFRKWIITRDMACDLGMDGYEIYGNAYIHHINPITVDDILDRSSAVFDPNNVITVSLGTHNAIHYGDESKLPIILTVRRPNDTCPWKV